MGVNDDEPRRLSVETADVLVRVVPCRVGWDGMGSSERGTNGIEITRKIGRERGA